MLRGSLNTQVLPLKLYKVKSFGYTSDSTAFAVG